LNQWFEVAANVVSSIMLASDRMAIPGATEVDEQALRIIPPILGRR
jgi:hypothetical protein